MSAVRHDTPCTEFHALDKRVEGISIIVDNHSTRLGVHSERIENIKEEIDKMQISQAKSTAVWSALGSAISLVVIFLLKWLMTKGG